jgi:hypothetical protein
MAPDWPHMGQGADIEFKAIFLTFTGNQAQLS